MRGMAIPTLSRMMRSSAVFPQDGAVPTALRAAAMAEPPEGAGDAEPALKWRTLWLSDIHLGTRDCKAPQLLEFLRHCSADTIYLVGDIIDGWQLKKKGIYWPQTHNDVVQKLLRKVRKGTRVVFVPGNHDEFARPYDGLHFGGIEVLNQNFFNEFTLKLSKEARPLVRRLADRDILAGVSLGRLYPGVDALQNGLVVAVTETTTLEDVETLAAALEEELA